MLNRFVTLPCTVNCVEPRGSKIEPHVCLHIILRNPEARFVQTAKVYLGLSMTLFGGLAMPSRRLGVVLPHTSPSFIHGPESIVGFGNTLIGSTLIGSLAKPLHRLSVVLWHAQAPAVHEGEEGLAQGITLLSGLAKPI